MADNDSRSGRLYLDRSLLDYTNRVHAGHDDGLAGAFDAPGREGIPAIQLGASEGKLIELLMRMIGARKVVEIGTLAGYSAIRLGRGLAEGGRVWTIEYDPRHAEIARANIAAAGLSDRIEVRVGAGLDVLPKLEAEGPFDAVFVDADKQNYDSYGAWAAANLRPGGLLLGDNAFLFGKLLEDDHPSAGAMRRFHEEATTAFDSVCVPTPDGLLLGIKR